MDSQLISFTSDEARARPAIAQVGRKWARIVLIDYPIKAIRVPASDARHFGVLMKDGKPYARTRAARLFKDAAKRFGATDRALKIIRAL